MQGICNIAVKIIPAETHVDQSVCLKYKRDRYKPNIKQTRTLVMDLNATVSSGVNLLSSESIGLFRKIHSVARKVTVKVGNMHLLELTK